jgi:hypothetical protein
MKIFPAQNLPNHTGAGQIYYGPFCVMSTTLFGWRVFPVVRPNTKCIFVWGGGGPRYWDIFWKAAKQARKENGAEPSLHGVWKSNCNVLTDDEPDSCNPISGGWPLRGLLCKIYKVDS